MEGKREYSQKVMTLRFPEYIINGSAFFGTRHSLYDRFGTTQIADFWGKTKNEIRSERDELAKSLEKPLPAEESE